MTATLGSLLVSTCALTVERYGIAHAKIDLVDNADAGPGSAQTLTIGTLAHVGVVITADDFGGQASTYWCAGVGGLDAKGNGVSAWAMSVASRPYHDDGGVMLSQVLADLERDAAVACGASPIGTVLEVPDRRIDTAGSWIRPAAVARDLLDALATAAGQVRGAWWVATDGMTHLGPRPSTAVTLSDLTVDDYDPATLRALVHVASDDIASLLPGASLTAPGLPAALPVAALGVRVEGDDITVTLWGELSQAELLAAIVQHVMAPRVDYLGLQPGQVTGAAASDGRVPVSAVPFGAAFPDAPLLGHAPGIPGASFVLAPGAAVVVVCLGGSPGSPVCIAYPAVPGILPLSVVLDAQATVSLGAGGTALANAMKVDACIQALQVAVTAAGHPATGIVPTGCTKAMGV